MLSHICLIYSGYTSGLGKSIAPRFQFLIFIFINRTTPRPILLFDFRLGYNATIILMRRGFVDLRRLNRFCQGLRRPIQVMHDAENMTCASTPQLRRTLCKKGGCEFRCCLRCRSVETCGKASGTYSAGSEGRFEGSSVPKQIVMARILLKNIRKVYEKDVVAVDNFDLEVCDKEFVVLVGPSGCGKSTTLRMIAGLEEITEGELFIGDRLVNEVPPKDRDIAMVFQNYALYPHMTVFDNMAFSLQLRKVKKDVIKEKVHEAADILGITDLLGRKPKALSGGQRQRVAIGRAIVREPKVFLMDEPLSNLDAKLRNQMRAEIIKLRERINTTFVYVTHDQTEAMTLGDRIVIMKDGFIQQIGTPGQVFNHPHNLFVAGFIGTPQMNFFPALLEESGGGYYVKVADTQVELTDEMQRELKNAGQGSAEITLGIRPEHIVVTEHGTPGAINVKVDVSEMMGSEVYIHVNFEGNDIIIRFPTASLPCNDNSSIKSGTDISFVMPGKLVHLFDRASGLNLLSTGE